MGLLLERESKEHRLFVCFPDIYINIYIYIYIYIYTFIFSPGTTAPIHTLKRRSARDCPSTNPPPCPPNHQASYSQPRPSSSKSTRYAIDQPLILSTPPSSILFPASFVFPPFPPS